MRFRLLAGIPAVLMLTALTACQEDEAGQEAKDDQAGASGVRCSYESDGQDADVELPPSDARYSGQVEATIATTAGDLAVTLDADGAPCTVNSFLSLAEQGFFDDTPCHRLTSYPTLSVLQCGDPTGQGTGGPGYTIPDELDTATQDYPAGTLAMANTGYPDSGGSQFFIVYGDSKLDPTYTVFGTIDQAGIASVAKVAADGSTPPQDGAPNTAVEIDAVTEK